MHTQFYMSVKLHPWRQWWANCRLRLGTCDGVLLLPFCPSLFAAAASFCRTRTIFWCAEAPFSMNVTPGAASDDSG